MSKPQPSPSSSPSPNLPSWTSRQLAKTKRGQSRSPWLSPLAGCFNFSFSFSTADRTRSPLPLTEPKPILPPATTSPFQLPNHNHKGRPLHFLIFLSRSLTADPTAPSPAFTDHPPQTRTRPSRSTDSTTTLLFQPPPSLLNRDPALSPSLSHLCLSVIRPQMPFQITPPVSWFFSAASSTVPESIL